MLSFLKNWRNKDTNAQTSQEEIEQAVREEEVREESVLPAAEGDIEADGSEEVKVESSVSQATPLSLHETWEAELSTNQIYALSFMASELPPVNSGTISLAGIKVYPHDHGVEVTAFIRNGTSRAIRIGKMNLVLLIGDDQVFARQPFDFGELGEIPAYHARPWSFVFQRENFLITNILLDNWKLAFETAQQKMVLPQQLELEESWIKALTDEQKESLIELAKRLPELKQGEVNVQSVQVKKLEDESFRVLLLFRNGSEKTLTIERLPLVLLDAQGEKVAAGSFELNEFKVNPGTSKPWLFIFPKESIVNPEPDLSRWKVALPQK